MPLPPPLFHGDVLQHKTQGMLSQECWSLKGCTALSEAGASLGSALLWEERQQLVRD